MSAEMVIRSLLFCPANEPRKVAKLSVSGADAGVLDLEDAVAASQKVAARPIARQALSTMRNIVRCVRVNAFDTGLTTDDVAAVVCPDLDVLVLPKVESVQDLRRLDRMIDKAEAANGVPAGQVKVIALIETAAGIVAAAEICAHRNRLIRVAFGSGDLGNDLALPTIRGDLSTALAYGRGKIVYDARAAGLPPPLDGPFLQVRDQVAMARDTEISRSLGHAGRVCIHPDQVPVANRIYGPDPAEVEFSRRVIAAFTAAEKSGSAAIALDGVFIDYPIVYKAERILALAEAIAARQATQAEAAA